MKTPVMSCLTAKTNFPAYYTIRNMCHPTSSPVCCVAKPHFSLLTQPSFVVPTRLAAEAYSLPPSLPHSSFLSPAQKDAVSSETEDSDRALKPGPPSNLLYLEKTTREEVAKLRGEKESNGQRDEGGGIGTEIMKNMNKGLDNMTFLQT